MTYLSAFEDFVLRTLAPLAGPLSKLVYIGNLSSDGRYEHWGLARTHGELAAAIAIADSHTEVWLEVLRTPIAKLAEELHTSAHNSDGVDVVEHLRERERALTPQNMLGGSKRHFSSILMALSLLSRAAKEAKESNQQAA
jgi:hypothetical protein